MILESAIMSVAPGREEEFLAALEQAKNVLAEAPGWQDIRVHRGIERPSTFLIEITWATLEDHTEGFRGSDLFVRWRELIGPHFDGTPVVEHFA